MSERVIPRFELHPESGKPIYAQLVAQVEFAVATGRLAPGDQLPTVRELAAELMVNPNTVARAYRDLERSGVIATSPGRGSFIRERPAGAPPERYKALEPQIRKLIALAREHDYDIDELITLIEQTAHARRRSSR